MANLDQPKGFEPNGPCRRSARYQAGGVIYQGDLVKLDANGQVVAAAASDACVGVALDYASAAGQSVSVADDPAQEFIAQADDATIDAQTDLNLNYDLIAGTPSTAYRRSGMQIDASTQAATATLPLKVLRVGAQVNNALGSKVDCICVINNHQLKGSTGTVGV